MMLNKAPSCKGIQAGPRGRYAAVIRCTAPVAEPAASGTQRDNASPSTSSTTAQNRVFRRITGPSAGRTQGSDPRVSGQTRPQYQPRAPTESDQLKPRLPSVTLLEDDVEWIAMKAEAIFTNHFSQGKGVIVRCLGRQGAAGALRFILALRDECDAASNKMDLQVRMQQQEPIVYFGTPLMLFVNPRKGREDLPGEVGARCSALIVSGRTDPTRLAKRIVGDLTNLQSGSFLRLEMVGADALFRGLTALQEAQSELPNFSSSFYLVPDLVSMRVREKQPREPQPGEGQETAEVSAADVQAAAQQQHGQETQAESLADEGLRVQVVRLYIGRTGRSAAGAGPAGLGTLAVGAPDSNGKVLVSEAELQELKGALGTMMEQQKRLTELLNQRTAAAAATTVAAVAEGASPQAQAHP